MRHIVAQVWVQQSYENSVVTMATKLSPSWSRVDWCKLFIHLRSLIVRHFGIIEATGLKIMALRSPSTDEFHKKLSIF
jgi:hypothetical protein